MNYNWGIIGPGNIAHKFAEGLQAIPQARLYGVASSSKQRAETFAATHNATQVYDSYYDLVCDPAIDVVYIATTNNSHYELASLCLQHKKPCLCEKPMTLTVEQCDSLIQLSKQNNTFLMEALWTRFLPSISTIEQCIQSGKIGGTQSNGICVNFGFKASADNERLFSPELGGGAMFDIGIYPLFLILHLLGEPQKIEKKIVRTVQNIDIDNIVRFYYESGAIADMEVSFTRNLSCIAIIGGSTGYIYMEQMWHCPCAIHVHKSYDDDDHDYEDITPVYTGNGYNYEIEEVHRCLREKRIESPRLPLAFSRNLVHYIHEILK
ncbi:MAG: Gfo/Idh/MocA family oxidoreductase [Bacteroidales bacterium]|jgi:predicted dehydrogenase|nr:Gfo/Idh/MocA family oxidoreductase [Bacteroidales bacterium]